MNRIFDQCEYQIQMIFEMLTFIMNQLESVHIQMNLISPRLPWIQLRELISNRAEEVTVLEFIDRTLQTMPKSQQQLSPQNVQIQILNKKLRKKKGIINQLSEQNKILQETLQSTKIDLEMAGIKCRNLQKNLKNLKYKVLRQERRERKRKEKGEEQNNLSIQNESSFYSSENEYSQYQIKSFNETYDQEGQQSDQSDQLEDQQILQELPALGISLNSNHMEENTNNPEQSEQISTFWKLFQFQERKKEDQPFNYIKMAQSQKISDWLLTPSCQLFRYK